MNIIRIPTVQYGYIEIQFQGSPEECIDEHNRLFKLYNKSVGSQAGLESKEWNATLDRYLQENTIDSNVWEKMNNDEKIIINEIKKSFKRAEARM